MYITKQINKMLETESLQVPFLENMSLTKIKSRKFKDRFLFTSTDILRLTEHVNFSQVRKDAELIESQDYIVIERKAQPEAIWKQLEDLNLIAKRSARVTLVYESGFWKMSMNCKTKYGTDLRNWLSNDVLPSIRETGQYTIPTFITPQILIENTKREIQLENSKLVNTKNYQDGGVQDVIKYNIDNCKQVTGKTPSQIKRRYGRPSQSAKEVLREFDIVSAMTMSLNDHLVVKENKELEDLKNLDKLVLGVFQEMLNIGLKLKP